MTLNCLIKTSDWAAPIFKVLSNNDTGSAPGHQGGVVIPEALRKHFPPLQGTTSEDKPTIDLRLQAELYLENQFIEAVSTRYQYQTWGGARSPESRLTDRLGPLRKIAKGGDVLVIQRSINEITKIRLTLVRKSSFEYTLLSEHIEGRRWGEIYTPTDQLKTREVHAEPEDEVRVSHLLEVSNLPHWAAIAFLARCARRFLECYQKDPIKSSAQRAVVAQAVALAETAASIGGEDKEPGYFELNGEILDSYDLDAIYTALRANENAAENSYADLQEDTSTERSMARILTAVSLAQLSFGSAIGDGQSSKQSISEKITLAIDWSLWGASEIEDLLVKDFKLLSEEVRAKSLGDSDPISPQFFPALWPNGRPPGWPAHYLSFRPRARIIRTIGDRLVSGPEAAVIELVKNSYDADASYAKIIFEPPLFQDLGSILFEDDGHGMTFADIEQKWMEPATSEKRDQKVSKGGRRVLGSKGIGRFAASRLGRYLELTSTAKLPLANGNDDSPPQIYTSRIPTLDWNLFENTKYLDDVEFEAESWIDHRNTGTSLKISSLRDDWSSQRILKLNEELRKLISPIQKSSSRPFRIFLDLSRCTEENSSFDGPALFGTAAEETDTGEHLHEVKPYPLLDSCDYAIDGVFDETGRFDGTMTIKRGGQEPEHITLDVPLQEDKGEEACGVVLVRLHLFDRENNAVLNTVANAGFPSIGIREARKLLDNIAGVAIYREGFRIRPYGDSENDWLTLDAKRVQNPSMRIGRNQISGVITVDDEKNSLLVERSSREGLEENGSFKRLRSLISRLLSEVVEPKRRQFRINAGLDNRNESNFRDIYDRVQLGWSKLLLAKIPEEDRSAAEELVTRESERLTQYVKRLEDRQAQLEARVTLGLIVGEVMHQGNTPLSFIETETSRVRKWWPTLFDSTPKAVDHLNEIPRILNGMQASGERLRALFDALNPLSGARRGDPEPYEVQGVIEQTLYLFKTKIEAAGIGIACSSDVSNPMVMGYSDDLSTALTNLIDNSIYWLEYHHVSTPQIEISVTQIEENIVLTVADNGVGIPHEFADQLFDIGFTLKPHGTGLGLSIAREAISRSNGALELSRATGGASFQIQLPTDNSKNKVPA